MENRARTPEELKHNIREIFPIAREMVDLAAEGHEFQQDLKDMIWRFTSAHGE